MSGEESASLASPPLIIALLLNMIVNLALRALQNPQRNEDSSVMVNRTIQMQHVNIIPKSNKIEATQPKERRLRKITSPA